MKVSSNFQLQEFVHPVIFNRIGGRSLDFLHPHLVLAVQDLRDTFGPIVVNDWMWGGRFRDSGLRMPNGTVGAELSAHRFGTAVDLKFADVTAEDVQSEILLSPGEYSSITRMENAAKTRSWLHLEVGVRHGEIVIFNP